MGTIFDNHHSVWTLRRKASCPVKGLALLVYSYLGKEDCYSGQTPSVAKICKATGLYHNTVDSQLEKLQECDFFRDGKVIAKPECFYPKSGGKHWYEKCSFWKCLVKEEDAPFDMTDAMVFSFLLHYQAYPDQAPDFWTDAYVSECLGFNARTIKASRERLQELKLFKEVEGAWGLPSYLNGLQSMWFRPKYSSTKSSGNKLVVFEPEKELQDKPIDGSISQAAEELISYLDSKLSSEFRREDYGKFLEIMRSKQTTVPPNQWEEYYSKLARFVRNTLACKAEGCSGNHQSLDGGTSV